MNPDWFVAGGTVVLAAVAVFQESIRGLFYRPKFRVTTETAPPHCHAVPITDKRDGSAIADSYYLRIWVENTGNATAKNVEVYAQALRRRRAENIWETVRTFPPMNLKWSNVGSPFFPTISPGMGKHCDVAHVIDPAKREHELLRHDFAPALKVTEGVTSLAIDLMVSPNHRGHVVGPGIYELEILVAAANARPAKYLVAIELKGQWDADETVMLRDHIAMSARPASG